MQAFYFLQNKCFDLSDTYSVVSIAGPDSSRFLNGQLTNDVSLLKDGAFQLQARLDRGGKLLFFFYLMRESEKNYYAAIPSELRDGLIEDLEKYIIMDDVSLTSVEENPVVIFSAYKDPKEFLGLDTCYKGKMAQFPAFLTFTKTSNLSSTIKPLESADFEKVMVLQGEPLLGCNAEVGGLVTDSIVNLNGVSLDKGCFLGQETVAKIETRRGGAYFPVILRGENSGLNDLKNGATFKINDKRAGKILWLGNDFITDEKVIVASLLRDFRVNGRHFDIEFENLVLPLTVSYIPRHDFLKDEKLTEELFEEAVKTFQMGNEQEAIEKFEEILKIDPQNEDSFEAIGVIFGRMERYQEGIDFMDKLLEANPSSVMAHTNKSLYFMRMGEIEKAEEEKAQATVKSFSQLGEEAKAKKQIEAAKKQEEAEIQRRYEMFQQVLEIDPEDTLANYGLADIYYNRNEPEKSVDLLQKVLAADDKYSVAYLLLGKVFVALGKIKEAKEIFEKGISIASAKGDLMPANDMQSRLSSLDA